MKIDSKKKTVAPSSESGSGEIFSSGKLHKPNSTITASESSRRGPSCATSTSNPTQKALEYLIMKDQMTKEHVSLGLVVSRTADPTSWLGSPQTRHMPPAHLSAQEAAKAWNSRGLHLLVCPSPDVGGEVVFAASRAEDQEPVAEAVNSPPHLMIRDKDIITLDMGTIPAFRLSFIQSSAATFQYLQKTWEENDMAYISGDFEERQKFLHQVSKSYRKNIVEYLKVIENCPEPRPEALVQEYYRFDAARSVWGLFEAAFIVCERRTSSFLFSDLFKSWVSEQISDAVDQDQYHYFIRLPDPSQDERFWSFIIQCLALGHNRAVIALLERVPESGRAGTDLHMLLCMIRKIPTFQKSQSNYLKQFESWQQDCKFHLSNKALVSSPKNAKNVKVIFEILCGKAETILASYDSWLSALAMLAIFHSPVIFPEEVGPLLPLVLDKLTAPSILDKIYIAFLKNKPLEGVVLCSQIDTWLVAHLNDLCTKIGIVEVDEMAGFFETECTYRCWTLLQLVEAELKVPGAFVTAIQYLKYCPIRGEAYLERYLQHIPVDLGAHDIDQALSLGKSCGINVQPIYRILAKHIWLDDLVQSVKYLICGRDARAIEALVDDALAVFRAGGSSSALLDLVDSLTNTALHEHEPLLFVARYVELLRGHKRPEETAAEVMALLSGAIVPPAFMDVILLHAYQLLKEFDAGAASSFQQGRHLTDSRPLFSVSDLFDLLRCLEEVQTRTRSAVIKVNERIQSDLEDLKRLISRYLSTTLLSEFE